MHKSGIAVFDLFTPAQCAVLLRRIAKLPAESPNSMNRYGTVLPWTRWVDRLVAKHLAFVGVPLAKTGHHAFVVEYSAKQRSLAAHFDASAVTLNVCIGGNFDGGALVFEPEMIAFEQKVGRAFIHRGSHVHRAKPIARGTRTNLVVWAKRRYATKMLGGTTPLR